jgi:hypothetical protein
MHFNLHLIYDACCYFFNIRSVMISKHSELAKRQAQDRYGRFTFPSSRTAPPPSRQEVGSSNRRRTAPSPSCMQMGSSSRHRTVPPPSSDDSSMEIWEVPPPPTRLGDSSSTSSGYNNEYPHVREVSSYEHYF